MTFQGTKHIADSYTFAVSQYCTRSQSKLQRLSNVSWTSTSCSTKIAWWKV